MATTAATRSPRVRAPDPVSDYARSVVAGEVLACEYVRLACERHLRDLETGHERGLRWNLREARKALDLFPLLEHRKGRLARKPLRLEPWQEFLIGAVFGWQRFDEDLGAWVRRFRIAYIEIPRKCGKTTIAAGVANKLWAFDGEAGAEVYCAATKRQQALICFSEVKWQIQRLRLKSTSARDNLVVMVGNLHDRATESKCEPLGADADTTDGLNSHGLVIDELHGHRDRKLWDVLEESMAARSQPLLFAITTAGYDRNTICWEQHEYAIKVLEGMIEDDAYFAFITTLDEGDDWTDEAVWPKAMPNLGISVSREYIRGKVRKALETPGLINSAQQKHFNIWTSGSRRWLDQKRWTALAVTRAVRDAPWPPGRIGPAGWLASLAGRRAFGGLDLGGSIDLNAFMLIVPDGAGGYDVVPRFWMPRDTIGEREEQDRVPYRQWADDGWITLTTGSVRDDDEVLAGIEELCDPFDVAEIAVDPWQTPNIRGKLESRGVTVVKIFQTFANLAGPSEELEKQIVAGTMRNDGNPVMDWMIGNVVADLDSQGNRKPSKRESTQRIDGVSALVTGMARAVGDVPPPPKKSQIF